MVEGPNVDAAMRMLEFYRKKQPNPDLRGKESGAYQVGILRHINNLMHPFCENLRQKRGNQLIFDLSQ